MLIEVGTLVVRAAMLGAVVGTSATSHGPEHDHGEPEASIVGEYDLESVGGLLDAIEEADKATASVSAEIQHVVINTLTGDEMIRRGSIVLSTDRTDMLKGQPMRRFMVRFDQLIVSGRADDEDRRLYTFDGRWLAERLEKDKQFNRWELVAPGERLDPFAAIDGGAFWLPFGQSRAQIERVATPSIADRLEWIDGMDMPAGLRKVAEDRALIQLRLVPKEGTKFAEHWDEVRTWFDPATLLPILYVAVEATGDHQIAWLWNVSANDLFPRELFDTRPPLDPAWQVSERRFRGDRPDSIDAEPGRIYTTIPAPPPTTVVKEAEPDGDAEGEPGETP